MKILILTDNLNNVAILKNALENFDFSIEDSEIHIITIFENVPINETKNDDKLREEAFSKAQKNIKKEFSMLKARLFTHLRYGKITEELTNFSRDFNIDLILTSYEQKNNIKLLLKDNPTAKKAIKYTKIPILLINNNLKKINRILLASDLSNLGEKSIRWLTNLPLKEDCNIDIITTTRERIEGFWESLKLTSKYIEQSLKKIERSQQDEIIQNTHKLEVIAKRKFNDVTSYIKSGNPANCIINHAKDNNTDLIVLGLKGITRFENFLTGFTIIKILEKSPCSVLIYKQN